MGCGDGEWDMLTGRLAGETDIDMGENEGNIAGLNSNGGVGMGTNCGESPVKTGFGACRGTTCIISPLGAVEIKQGVNPGMGTKGVVMGTKGEGKRGLLSMVIGMVL